MLMVFLLNINKKISHYFFNRKLLVLFIGYYLISIILYVFFEIDILLPCLFKTIFNTACIGCGITKAFIQFLSLDLIGAYQSNPFVYILLPILAYAGIEDFRRVNRRLD